jgi:hypothetical protein
VLVADDAAHVAGEVDRGVEHRSDSERIEVVLAQLARQRIRPRIVG